MRTRPDSRRDYRHFPREYTDLLVRFEQSGYVVLTFPEARQAHAARRELYRFKTFVSAGVDDDSNDAHARWLLDVFNTVTMRLEALADGTHALILDSNPLVRAMRASAAGLRPEEGEAHNSANEQAQPPEPPPTGRRSVSAERIDPPATHPSPVDGLFIDQIRANREDYFAKLRREHPRAEMVCPQPDACRSVFNNSPAFCECGDAAKPQEKGTDE